MAVVVVVVLVAVVVCVCAVCLFLLLFCLGGEMFIKFFFSTRRVLHCISPLFCLPGVVNAKLAKRSSLYNLGSLLSHSARLYQSPMICTRSDRPRSAPSRAQCTWKSVGSLKSGRCFRTNLTHFALTTGSVGN